MIIEALRQIGVNDPTSDEIEQSLGTLTRIMSSFAYWIEADLPAMTPDLETESPFPEYYNDAFIIKLALRECTPYKIPGAVRAELRENEREIMAMLHYKESLGRTPKTSMTVI